MTAAMKLHRQPVAAQAGVVAPPESRRALIWDRPVPGIGRAPLVWLLGVHGGAGASTLAHVLAPAADSGRRWPGVFDRESPFVVLVARETIAGLTRAHDLLRQHHSGFAGAAEVLGLITVAARPGRLPAEIRRYREVVGSLAGQVWQVPWYEEWTLVEPEKLPVWAPGDALPQKKRKIDPLEEVPLEVRDLGTDIVAAVRENLDAASSFDEGPE
ncbi:DUF6668 family protein [Nocardia sp. GCM10030253]|uniref:DUF6668 family protein n=1 Tax=Nocardia sp. GCM10030253 TaxID=3273404 RepID=UPI00362F04E3